MDELVFALISIRELTAKHCPILERKLAQAIVNSDVTIKLLVKCRTAILRAFVRQEHQAIDAKSSAALPQSLLD